MESEALLFKLRDAFNAHDTSSILECFDEKYSSEKRAGFKAFPGVGRSLLMLTDPPVFDKTINVTLHCQKPAEKITISTLQIPADRRS